MKEVEESLRRWRNALADRVARMLSYAAIGVCTLSLPFDWSGATWDFVMGDALVICGAIVSLTWSGFRKRNDRPFVWQPLFIGFWLGSAQAVTRTGGLTSPFLGFNLASLFMALLVLPRRHRPWSAALFTTANLILYGVAEAHGWLPRAVPLSPLTTTAFMVAFTSGLMFCGIGLTSTNLALARQSLRHKTESEAASAANIAKTTFLANISHEIRTPLSLILGHAEVIDSFRLDAEGQAPHLATIQRAGRQLVRLVEDLSDLARIDSNKLSLEPQTVDIAALLMELGSELSLAASERGLSFERSMEPGAPKTLVTDPLRLRQILTNLLTNAIKHTEKGGLKLSVRRTGDGHVSFEVSDTGSGLSATAHSRLFEPFAHGGSPRGSGLGLALSKKLAQALGGDLRLISSVANRGTAFELVLAERAESLSAPTPPPTESSNLSEPGIPSLSGIRVLIVEDIQENREILRIFLEAQSAEVDEASDGVTALETIESKDYDMVLMDMHMPRMNGVETTRRLRSRGYRKPIFAVTANVLIDQLAEYSQAGCDEILTKPIDRRHLIERIHRAVKGTAS